MSDSKKDHMIYVNGSKTSFRCEGSEGHPCGCNVFRKIDDTPRFRCNACGAVYSGVKL